MKRSSIYLLAGSLACILLVLGIITLIFINQDYFQESGTKYYKSYHDAELDGAVGTGWLPAFLPKSAADIYEKHNFDYNRVRVKFSFKPTDLSVLLKDAIDVPKSRFREIAPAWTARNEKWWPNQISKGEADWLARNGYRLYEFGAQSQGRIVGQKIVKWFIAVDSARGIAYAWS